MRRESAPRSVLVFALLVLTLSVAGCTIVPRSSPWAKSAVDGDIIGASHAAADSLYSQTSGSLSPNRPLIVATFVNIDNLEQTSSFGRIVAQQFATRFTQLGFPLIEILLRKDIYIKQKGGEFLLTREFQLLSEAHNAQAVIVGTYASGKGSVFVTSKLVRAKDNTVMASFDYRLPVGPDTHHLLQLDG